MRAMQSASRATLDATAARLDGVMGYPMAGVDVGGGTHAPPWQSVTTTRARVVQDKGGILWVYPVDVASEPLLLPAEAILVVTIADAVQVQAEGIP